VKTVAIVQARTGSSRLPRKVLLPLLGEPLLTRVMRRLGRAERLDESVVATTVDAADDPIADLAVREGWPVVRGSVDDLLDRYVEAARARDADVVVRITSDCPLIDPAIVDETVSVYEAGECDYAATGLEPRTFPRGLDVEVVARAALEQAWRDDTDPAWREHATPYIYRHPELFRLCRVASQEDRSAHRWTVDTPEDYELVRRIYEALGRDDFSWREALAVVEAHPDWMELNRSVVQKVVPPSQERDARRRMRMTDAIAAIKGRTLFLRADGSERIGLGHVMRLLALGQAWVDAGGRVEGLLGEVPTELLERYEREGFRVRRIDAGTRGPFDDGLSGMLRDDLSAVAAIDRPGLSLGELEALADGARRSLVVDDMALLPDYPVALVLNQNAHADRAAYPSVSDERLMLGLPYVLLRREFRSQIPSRTIPPRAGHILITFGGGDPTAMTARTLDALALLPARTTSGLLVRVIVGSVNAAVDEIQALADSATVDVTVVRGTDDMVGAMVWADLAITSGGSTVWELARTGCPALVVATAPAEVSLSSGLDRIDLFDRLGTEAGLDLDRLAATIDARLTDRAWRAQMSQRATELVDGEGVRRVVSALAALHAR
jgi:spore coat polysaccharide biosynthesis protein SpsF